MATKRQLKKFMRSLCGAAAAEMLLAKSAFPEMDRKKVYDVITKIASIQSAAVHMANMRFDKKQKDFGSKAEYEIARRKYMRKSYDELISAFNDRMVEIVHDMNEAMPEQARKEIKEFIAGTSK